MPPEPDAQHWAAGASLGGDGTIDVLESDDLLGVGMGSAILIADDDPTNRIAYEAALAPLGRACILVSSGLEALATLLEQDVALVLLDVQMPQLNGIETARMLRGRARNRGTPIIFITGMTGRSDIVRDGYELGALDFVIKPIEPDILRAKVRLYLQLQERTRDVQRQRQELRVARLQLEEEKASRERIHAADVATARRFEKLQEVTARLTEAKTPDEVAAVVTQSGTEAIDASSSVMWLADHDGALTVVGSHGVPAHYLDVYRSVPPGAAAALRRVFDRCQAIWVETEEDFQREAPEHLDLARAADRVRSFASLPLAHRDRAIGAITFSYLGLHRFDEEERRYLTVLTHACTLALERSRRYEAEAEARQRAETENARKDEFLAMLGHELRNPLASITSALDVLKVRGVSFGREMSIVARQVTHLAHLVHALVDVSRLTQGKVPLRRSIVSLEDALQLALEAVRPDLDLRHHQLDVDVAPGLLLDADRDRVCQVLVNLLGNAARYTPDRGHIRIAARLDGDVVEIEVRDSGIGISAALLPTVFDIFVQGQRDIARRDGGLGVGLTVVRRLVELHGGSVSAQSDGEGTGATFTVRWPSASVPGRATTGPQPVLEASKLTVLIVDDNTDAAELLAALLGELGHEARVAHDGRSALRLVESIRPDIALLDIGLPDVSGYELVEQLRPLCPTTLMVAVTGYAQAEDRDRAKRAGFDRHFAKPIEVRQLTDLLHSVRRTP